MRYYPALLDIKEQNCLVVGGGSVGTRKAGTLLKCGARVTVVSIDVSESIEKKAKSGQLTLRRRSYRSTDLEGMFMVIGATDNAALNRQIRTDAEARHILCNIADRPQLCNFILPSVIQRGDLILAISTSGKSPAFSKALRKKLEMDFGEEYAQFLQLMGAIRKRMLAEDHAPEAHKPLFEKLITGDLLDMIRRQDFKAVDKILLDVLGEGYIYKELSAPPEA